MRAGRANLFLIAFGVFIAVITAQARVSQPPAATPADLVLTNGKIVTVEDGIADAQAVAIAGGRIAAIGAADAVRPYIGPSTRVIDLHGQLAIPGFIESHGHFTGIGDMKMELDLTTAKSWDDIVSMVADAVTKSKPGEWIYGRGWHQEKWTSRPQPNVEGFPTHPSLDKVSPDNPVVLEHASGHASFVNGKAMELSGIKRSTESPAGGDVLRDSTGDATGLMRETAQRLIKEPQLSGAERAAHLRKELELANQDVLSKGVTTFVDAGSPLDVIDGIRSAVDEGAVGVRMWVMIRQPNAAFASKLKQYRTIDHADGHFTVRAIKKIMDGALGSRGAWMLQPYADKPGWTGLNTTSLAEIR
jgi:predicted amidohydrolase YtcJ